MSRAVPGGARPEWPQDPDRSESYGGDQRPSGNQHYGHDGRRAAPGTGPGQYGAARSYDRQGSNGYGGQGSNGYGQARRGQRGYAPRSYDQTYGGDNYGGQGWESGSQPTQRYDRSRQPEQDVWYYRDTEGDEAEEPARPRPRPRQPGRSRKPGQPTGPRTPARKVRFRRTRRLFRRRIVRVIAALVAVFFLLATASAGQAAFRNNGQGVTANLAEWFRDHNMGFFVTFGEWLTYNPPKKGGKPSFSLAVPKGEQATAAKAAKGRHKGFVPDIPAPLKAIAGAPLAGEGQWRVVEKVHGQPAIFTTFLRDATYTSYVNGIASMDPRLVKFQLHPGSEDPGPGNWGAWGSDYIAPGSRTGLLATFNGGFKLDSANGGFYLNGQYHGSLVNGAATIVYYKNGTIKIGEWGRDFKMNSQIEGARQNLKLLIDHGKIAPNLNQNIETNFGATLGGGYYVWRSGLGVTKDGRIIYVYGPALNVQDLAEILKQAGAVEAMQMDINPFWMKYEYYTVQGNPANPVPNNLLPTQQQSAYTYYSPYTRDFTAVYAR